MKTPRRLVPAYLAAFAMSIYLLPQDHAAAETLQVNGIEMYYEIIGEGEPPSNRFFYRHLALNVERDDSLRTRE